MTSNPVQFVFGRVRKVFVLRKLTIDTTLDPDVSVLITGSTITGIEESGVWLSRPKSETTSRLANKNTNPHVGIEVAVMVLPDAPGD